MQLSRTKWETGHQQTYSTTGLGMYHENGKSIQKSLKIHTKQNQWPCYHETIFYVKKMNGRKKTPFETLTEDAIENGSLPHNKPI